MYFHPFDKQECWMHVNGYFDIGVVKYILKYQTCFLMHI
jgi:hypothetical protein